MFKILTPFKLIILCCDSKIADQSSHFGTVYSFHEINPRLTGGTVIDDMLDCFELFVDGKSPAILHSVHQLLSFVIQRYSNLDSII